MKRFENLLRSEIKKAEAAANKALGVKNCKVTGYSVKKEADIGAGEWYEVICEICHDYETRADVDVVLHIPMFDRRRTWAKVK